MDIALSDNILSEIIKKDEKFFDKNNQFSRIKYEKFLISNNFSAALYEKNLKNEETNKLLFNYIGGGTFPPSFLIKNIYNYLTFFIFYLWIPVLYFLIAKFNNKKPKQIII